MNPARAWPLLAVAVVASLDIVVTAVGPPLLLLGVLDEIAHVLTTAVLLLACRRTRYDRVRVSLGAALAGTVLIDADHIPLQLFGDSSLTQGTPRPYSHSVSSVLLLLLLARVVRDERARGLLTGCAAGIGLHLVRDVGTAPVALAWPFWWGGVQVPYAAYLLVLVAAGLACTIRGTGLSRRGYAVGRGATRGDEEDPPRGRHAGGCGAASRIGEEDGPGPRPTRE
jgi:inner membrane protein